MDANFRNPYSPSPIKMDKIVVLKPQNSVQMVKKQSEKKKVERPVVKTRFGYDARDCVKNLQDVLSQAGPTATGKALHYSADLVCSRHRQRVDHQTTPSKPYVFLVVP